MKLIKSNKGMTILEIVVAIGVLGFISVGIMGFFTGSFTFQSRNEKVVVAQRISDEAIEKLKSNMGKIETLDGQPLDITECAVGETISEIKLDENYETKIKVNNIHEIAEFGNTKLYDVTVTVINKKDATIAASVSSAIRINQFIKCSARMLLIVNITTYLTFVFCHMYPPLFRQPFFIPKHKNSIPYNQTFFNEKPQAKNTCGYTFNILLRITYAFCLIAFHSLPLILRTMIKHTTCARKVKVHDTG